MRCESIVTIAATTVAVMLLFTAVPIAAKAQAEEAAADLQEYLEKISGARLPIAREAENPEGPRVYVGRSDSVAATFSIAR